ncbi:MAG: catalase/peroxidase HPI [Gammaproteobacteria bacterium]|nr:catalase/peroxidase HPI [Gammaproteobacteria bacterium]
MEKNIIIQYAMLSCLSLNLAFASPHARNNQYWWPNKLDLSSLRHADNASPLPANYHYRQAFKSLDVDALIQDLKTLMTRSQDWWPADYGTYGPFFIRMSWHSAGTYRVFDGRGGAEGAMQRFEPLNSWPDNVNLDKARRLLLPIKQKYGQQISWSDLLVLAGNVAMESMGFKTLGFAFGREDAWIPETVNWGHERTWLASHRQDKTGGLKKPYGATQMGLIYVNPEGPNGQPDPLLAAKDIRTTFARMAMNDEETVALIVGGHAFGKAHGAADAKKYLGPAPAGAPIEAQGLGWHNSYQSGKGKDTISSGLEGAWSLTPTHWSNSYLQNLYQYDWVQEKSPAGATQWVPSDKNAKNVVPDAHDPSIRHAPIMFTTDLAMKMDPSYQKITQRFLKHPDELEKAYAKAWFKLIHRDMGPSSRYLGKLVPTEAFIWQDPIPEVNHELVNPADIRALKSNILGSGLTVPQLVKCAWASASSFRSTDKRGGANGGRIRLAPQHNWAVNEPIELAKVLKVLTDIQHDFNQEQVGGKQISMADLIVLAGNAAIEKAAHDAGVSIELPFSPGRGDAIQDMTDVSSFGVLEPQADAFRHYQAANIKHPEQKMVEKASMLNLSAPEMTVLIGGLRILDANFDHSPYGVLTKTPGKLTNDFFVNLLNMDNTWKPAKELGIYEAFDKQGHRLWQATSIDLIFGSDSELRAIAEYYAEEGMQKQFITDFTKAWTKVMNLDRFDLHD